MSACANCQAMVEILKRQIAEMTQREQELKRINLALVQAVENENPTADPWKQKYQEEAEKTIKLQRKLLEITNTSGISERRRSYSKKDIHRESSKKTFVDYKYHKGGEFILKIIDARRFY